MRHMNKEAHYDATPHNPLGVGWKKHGHHGYFIRKHLFTHDQTVSCLTGIIVMLIIGMIYLIYG